MTSLRSLANGEWTSLQRDFDVPTATVGHRSVDYALADQAIAVSHKGSRQENQDSFWPQVVPACSTLQYLHGGRLYVVADGASGGSRPREAAALAATTVGETYYQDVPRPDLAADACLRVVEQRLQAAVYSAHERLLSASAALTSQRASMQAACAAALIFGHRLFTAHVGDCRVYRWRNGALSALTNDHVNQSGTVTRLLGAPRLSPDQVEIHFDPSSLLMGDVLLLCSDGLSRYLTSDVIAETLRTQLHGSEGTLTAKLGQGAVELVKRVADSSESDNITVLLVGLTEGVNAEMLSTRLQHSYRERCDDETAEIAAQLLWNDPGLLAVPGSSRGAVYAAIASDALYGRIQSRPISPPVSSAPPVIKIHERELDAALGVVSPVTSTGPLGLRALREQAADPVRWPTLYGKQAPSLTEITAMLLPVAERDPKEAAQCLGEIGHLLIEFATDVRAPAYTPLHRALARHPAYHPGVIEDFAAAMRQQDYWSARAIAGGWLWALAIPSSSPLPVLGRRRPERTVVSRLRACYDLAALFLAWDWLQRGQWALAPVLRLLLTPAWPLLDGENRYPFLHPLTALFSELVRVLALCDGLGRLPEWWSTFRTEWFERATYASRMVLSLEYSAGELGLERIDEIVACCTMLLQLGQVLVLNQDTLEAHWPDHDLANDWHGSARAYYATIVGSQLSACWRVPVAGTAPDTLIAGWEQLQQLQETYARQLMRWQRLRPKPRAQELATALAALQSRSPYARSLPITQCVAKMQLDVYKALH